MAGWDTLKNFHKPNLKVFDENDLMMGIMVSQKQDLIQNCDLPPPMKVFSGSEPNSLKRKNAFSSTDAIDEGDGKLGLLKALRLSQTRAREAEAKYGAISKERDLITVAFMENSMEVYAYRHLVRLLECQVSRLKKQRLCCDCGKRENLEDDDDGGGGGGGGGGGVTWIMAAVAFCLGIAGFGFAFGCF